MPGAERKNSLDDRDMRTAIFSSDFEQVKKAIAALPTVTLSQSGTPEYATRCIALRVALKDALQACSLPTNTESTWKIALYIHHELCRDFPGSVKYHIENFTTPPERHTLLAYDNIPIKVLSQLEHTPFNSVWQSIFVVHGELLEACSYKVPDNLLYLAQAFRAMGWGREIPLETAAFEAHIKRSLPNRGLAIILVPQKHIKGVLSQLVQAIKAGATKEYVDLEVEIMKRTAVPRELSALVCGYMGFFPPEKKEAEPAAADNSGILCCNIF